MKRIRLTEEQFKYCVKHMNENQMPIQVKAPLKADGTPDTIKAQENERKIEAATGNKVETVMDLANESVKYTKKQLKEARVSMMNAEGKKMTKKEFESKIK